MKAFDQSHWRRWVGCLTLTLVLVALTLLSCSLASPTHDSPPHLFWTLRRLSRLLSAEDANLPGSKDDARDPPIHNAFELISSRHIKGFNFTVAEYRHRKSHATAMLVMLPETDDVNGMAACFETPPVDETGVFRAFEFSLDQASKRFPVKDLIREQMKGSLYRTVETIAGPKWTCYHVESDHEKDFVNLASVRLDSVLNSITVNDPVAFRNLVWRYQVRLPDTMPITNHKAKEAARLYYDGVTFNSVKKRDADTHEAALRVMERELLPNTTSWCYDGDSQVVPTLTFEKYKEFYQKYYHPSNAKFFFYGSTKAKERLDLLDSYLSEFDAPQHQIVPIADLQPIFEAPRYVTQQYNGVGGHDSILMAWVLDTYSGDPQSFTSLSALETSVYPVLHELLMSDRGVVVKAFAARKPEYLSHAFVSIRQKQTIGGIVLRGVRQSPTAVQEVEDLFLESLTRCVRDGISNSTIDWLMNDMELTYKDTRSTVGLPEIIRLIHHDLVDGRDPLEMLNDMHYEHVVNLRDRLQDGERVFETLIQKHFLDNPHRVTIHFQHDKEFDCKREKSETDELNNAKQKMSDEEFKRIYQEGQQVEELQAAPVDPEKLKSIPRLSMNDLDVKVAKLPTVVKNKYGATVLTHELPTNGVVFVDVALTLDDISIKDFPLLKLLVHLMTKTGTSTMKNEQYDEYVYSHTTGVTATIEVRSLPGKNNSIPGHYEAVGYLVIRVKALARKAKILLEILKDLLIDSNLGNPENAIEFMELAADASIASRESLGSDRIAAASTSVGYAQEILQGITSKSEMRLLLKQAETDWPAFEERLKQLRHQLVVRRGMVINLTGDAASLKSAMDSDSLKGLIDAIPNQDSKRLNYEQPKWTRQLIGHLLPRTADGFSVSGNAISVTLGGMLYKPIDQYSGSSLVASVIISSGYLSTRLNNLGVTDGIKFSVRECGHFEFTSRGGSDWKSILGVYMDTSEEFVKEVDRMTDQDLMEKKLAAIRALELDSPQTVGSKGYAAMWDYLVRPNRELTMTQVVQTTREELRKFGVKLSNALNDKTNLSIVVLAPESALQGRGDAGLSLIIHELS